jgi:hypothetical protein
MKRATAIYRGGPLCFQASKTGRTPGWRAYLDEDQCFMWPELLSAGSWLSELSRVAQRMQLKKTTTMTGTTKRGEVISMEVLPGE